MVGFLKGIIMKKKKHAPKKKHEKKEHKREKRAHSMSKSSSHAQTKHHDKKHSMDSEHPKKNFIAGAIKHPGALRKELHVKKGHKIPMAKLKKASHAKGVEGRRARLAMVLKRLGHRKHKKGE
jgi:hypothetical protein